MYTAPLALLVAPGGFHMHTPPASLVASVPAVATSEVDQSVRAAIADLPSKESQRTYECAWRFYSQWLAAMNHVHTNSREKSGS